MTLDTVRAAYGTRAREYVDAVGAIEHVDPEDLALIADWARGVTGMVLDVGCGPGQWTHFLAGLGVDVEGLDPTPEFVELARSTYPAARFRIGTAEDLDVAEGTLGGILAWYSLFHTEPARIDLALAEFARAVRPEGHLALGFFAGPEVAPFDHAITTAYFWPVDALAAKLETAGFRVDRTGTRDDRPGRTHAAILATRVR